MLHKQRINGSKKIRKTKPPNGFFLFLYSFSLNPTMKKLSVLILLILCACKHQTPIEKAQPIAIRYLDSIGKHDSILYIHEFRQIGKYSFTCQYVLKERGTGFPQFATGFFEFDKDLTKVKKFDFDTH